MIGARRPTQLIQWERLTGLSSQTLLVWAREKNLPRDGKSCYEFEDMRDCICSRKGAVKLVRNHWKTSVTKLKAMTYEDFNEQSSRQDKSKLTKEVRRRVAKREKEEAQKKKAPRLFSPPKEIPDAPMDNPESTSIGPEIPPASDDGVSVSPGTLYKMPDGSIDAIDWSDSDCVDPDTGCLDMEVREKKYRGFRQKLAAARDRSELVKRDYALAFLNASYMKILTALNTLPDRTASKILALVESDLSPTDRATEIRKCLESATDEVIRSVHDEMTDTGGRLDSTVKSCIARQGGNRL